MKINFKIRLLSKILFIIILIQGSSLFMYSQEQEILKQARTTNLVIINDVIEQDDGQAMSANLKNALNSNQVVFCTKSIWLTIRAYMGNADTESLLNDILEESDKYDKDHIKNTKWYQVFKDYLNSLESIDTSLFAEFKNKFKNDFMKNLKDEEYNIIEYFLNLTHDVLEYMQGFTNNDLLFKMKKNEYICKDIENNFLLFIPKSKQINNPSNIIKDAWLGLSYTKYPDYNFLKPDLEKNQVLEDSYFLSSNINILSKNLFDAIQKLKIEQNSISGQLPFFNIFLTGHGSDTLIAEISITPIDDTDTSKNQSYFLKLINLFNQSFRTISFTTYSCYPGGKKLIDAYQIKNKLSNQFLESIPFPIINIGTLYNVVTIHFQATDLFNIYFSYLEETPPNYTKIADFFKKQDLNNYIYIKFPNTSWFSPVELEGETVKLSQIEMATKEKNINIENKEIIFLGASYVPKTITINRGKSITLKDIPLFLADNYYNQEYYFSGLDLSNLSTLDSNIDQNLYLLLKTKLFETFSNQHLPQYKVMENIRFLFEKIKIGNQEYKNVYCFHSATKSGFFYFKEPGFLYFKGNEFIQYEWHHDLPSNIADNVTKKILSKAQGEEILKNFKEKALKQFPKNLNPEFIENLKKKIMSEEIKKKQFLVS